VVDDPLVEIDDDEIGVRARQQRALARKDAENLRRILRHGAHHLRQGDFSQTKNPLDMAIEGRGFFKVLNNLLGIEWLTAEINRTASWHRPHRVQASKSKSCFQVKFSILGTPNVSAVSRSMGVKAPLGFRERKKVFRGTSRTCCMRERATKI
jgi:hypothetical protein